METVKFWIEIDIALPDGRLERELEVEIDVWELDKKTIKNIKEDNFGYDELRDYAYEYVESWIENRNIVVDNLAVYGEINEIELINDEEEIVEELKEAIKDMEEIIGE